MTTDAGAIFRSFEDSDIGIDGAIELLTAAGEPSGTIVLVQIKAGRSYIRKGRFFLNADRAHFETWSRYALPVAGIVCDVESGTARWVDVSGHLRSHPSIVESGPYSIEAPIGQPFSAGAFGQFAAHFSVEAPGSTTVTTLPNLSIRPWVASDEKPTRALLSVIAPDYPEFDVWLGAKLRDARASKKVVDIAGVVAGFSMWQRKDSRNVKLQTFIVSPSHRGAAVGQHLLYHEIRTWAEDSSIERVHVTIAAGKTDLLGYLTAFGFRVEGFSANRYDRDAAELVLAKHFVRDVVRTPDDLDRVGAKLRSRIWGLAPSQPTRFGVSETQTSVPLEMPPLTFELNRDEGTVTPRLKLRDPSGRDILTHSDESLMRDFYPLRIHLRKKRYVIIPIYREWADSMLARTGTGTRLKLRTDNVYYCYPKLSDLDAGDLAIFYETKTRGGTGGAIGAVVIQEVKTDLPEALFRDYASLGVYTVQQIHKHAGPKGKAMAIRFSLFEPFPSPVALDRMRQMLRRALNMQGLTPISRDGFESIRSEGLTQ